MDELEYVQSALSSENLFYGERILKPIENIFSIPHFLKEDWNISYNNDWFYVMNKNEKLPEQGWKIHISAKISEAADLLYNVASLLKRKGVSFKFVPNLDELLRRNYKYAERSSSGKFITIYPASEEKFIILLDELDSLTIDFSNGPYILNDKQWKQGNVFFRYGGFLPMEVCQDGEKVAAIKRPDGKLIPDMRVPYYYLPDFVHEPVSIKLNNVLPDDKEFEKLQRFDVKEALHFSNAGGVYVALDQNKKKVILKEGRSEAGVDSDGSDGFKRIKREYYALKRLESISGVVKVNEFFIAWEHAYLSEEYINGKTINDYIATDFPFSRNEKDTFGDIYAKKSMKIIEQIVNTVRAIHNKGMAVGDLQPQNILLCDQEQSIKIIDFETATDLNEKYKPKLRTPGFSTTQVKSFYEEDWYAVYKIAFHMFLPIEPVCDLAPQLAFRQLQQIRRWFGDEVSNFLFDLEADVAAIANIFPKPTTIKKPLLPASQKITKETLDKTIRNVEQGLLNYIDYTRQELIFGDIKQYSSTLSRYSILNGAFGAIMALIKCDKDLPLEVAHQLSDWIDNCLPIIKKISQSNENDMGLFTGISGIAGVLFELGRHSEAVNLARSLDKDSIEISKDISLKSGLAGIGLSQLSFFKMTSDTSFSKASKRIADRLMNLFDEVEKSSIDASLLIGWTGVSLFLCEMNFVFKQKKYIKYAISIIDTVIQYRIKSDNDSKDILILDDRTGMEKLVPYLENGTIGLSLVMIEIANKYPEFLNDSRRAVIGKLIDSCRMYCSYLSGLFSGYAGFLLLGSAVSSAYGNTDSKYASLESLNMYALSNNPDEIIFPGNMGFKCAMDLETGSAGILLALDGLEKNNWGNWIPVPMNKNFNFFRSSSKLTSN